MERKESSGEEGRRWKSQFLNQKKARRSEGGNGRSGRGAGEQGRRSCWADRFLSENRVNTDPSVCAQHLCSCASWGLPIQPLPAALEFRSVTAVRVLLSPCARLGPGAVAVLHCWPCRGAVPARPRACSALSPAAVVPPSPLDAWGRFGVLSSCSWVTLAEVICFPSAGRFHSPGNAAVVCPWQPCRQLPLVLPLAPFSGLVTIPARKCRVDPRQLGEHSQELAVAGFIPRIAFQEQMTTMASATGGRAQLLSALNCCAFLLARVEGLMDSYTQGFERSYTVNSSILHGIEPRLKDFHQLLLNPPKVRQLPAFLGSRGLLTCLRVSLPLVRVFPAGIMCWNEQASFEGKFRLWVCN